jgi:hypothetical protein
MLSGTYAQQPFTKPRADEPEAIGVARLQAVVANVLWDWHNLARADARSASPGRFEYAQPGDLHWVPDWIVGKGNGGARAEVVEPPPDPGSARQQYHVALKDNWFVELQALLRSREIALLGAVRPSKSGKKILFPRNLDRRQILTNHISGLQREDWQELIQIYACLDTDALITLASCRNRQATTLTIAAAAMRWCTAMYSHLSTFANCLRCFEGEPLHDSLNDGAYLLSAKQALASIPQTLTRQELLPECIERARVAARSSDLHADVPTTGAKLIPIDCEGFLGGQVTSLIPRLEAITTLVDVMTSRLLHGWVPDSITIGTATNILRADGIYDSRDTSLPFWSRWLCEATPDFNFAVRASQRLTTGAAQSFQEFAGIRIERVPEFYEDVLSKYYPLPTIGRRRLSAVRADAPRPQATSAAPRPTPLR